LKKDNYTVDELVSNDSFRRWATGNASEKERKKWNQWVRLHEENRLLAKRATEAIVGFTFQRPDMPDLNQEWEQVHRRIEKPNRPGFPLDYRSGIRYSWLYAAAAVLLVSIVVGVSIYTGLWKVGVTQQQIASVKTETIKTGPDERKTITLSDGSTIILDANASITYSDGWELGKEVHISLDGKAYFSIHHRQKADRPVLQVITSQGVIRDLGTQFFVSASHKNTTVVLEEGSVSIEPKVNTKAQSLNRLNIQPGELVEVSNNGYIKKKSVNPTLYTSWATGVLQFNYTPVAEFARRIEQMYNIRVVVNPELFSKKLNGAVYYRSIGDLVKAVSQVLKVPVYRSESGDTIYIGNKTNTSNN
jgi:ferric-dicitrate binding protein FerR (iron transport regulator)